MSTIAEKLIGDEHRLEPGAIAAHVGFSMRDGAPISPDEKLFPGFPDNRVEMTPCIIHDARAANPSLAREGFELVRHESLFASERDLARLAQGYYAEMAPLLKDYLGADLVGTSRHGLTVRYGEQLIGRRLYDTPPDVIDSHMPAPFAHIDYRPEIIPEVLGFEAELGGEDPNDYSRIAIIQTWRAVSGPPLDLPLAICDRRTLSDDDIVSRTGLLSPDEEGGDPIRYEIGGICYNPKQRWHYYPDMQPDELLIFTGYDSAASDAWKVGHAAFDNRHIQPKAVSRVSIEARFYVLYR